MWELFRDIYVICFHLILPVCCVCMCVYGVEGLSDFAEAGVCVCVGWSQGFSCPVVSDSTHPM